MSGRTTEYYLPIFGESYNFCLAEQTFDLALARYETMMEEKKQQFMEALPQVPVALSSSWPIPSSWARGEYFVIMRTWNNRSWECVRFSARVARMDVIRRIW